jgi:hypothetical protein
MFAPGQEADPTAISAEILKQQQDANIRESRRVGKDLYTNILRGFAEGNIFDPANKDSVAAVLNDAIKKVTDPREILKRTADLDAMAAKLRNTLGLGTEKSREFSQAIADNAGRFIEYGFDIEEVVDTYEDLFKTYRTNVTISDEELLQLKSTAAVTAQGVGTLTESFRAVGVGINEIGDRMLEVTNIAKDAGVAVSAVAAGVVSNLEKMNIYNFEGGTKGLAKMSAQAARLNIDMGKIFTVVDKVFNPEGAIELAASLQRLGVSANALLDPLRLMDLSQNDPAELQNQIVEMSKDFVRFNETLGQFEILPGEKRRLNEIGKELGMTSGELQKMAINAANLDHKMKQIKFPSSIASKEDRELIATLATVNKEGIAEIKVKQFDDKGNETGQFEIVEASQLTAKQIEALKKDQQSRGLTMEELQKENLTELQRLNYLVESIVTAIAYGESGSMPARELYEFGTKKVRETLFTEGDRQGIVGEEFRNSKQYRQTIDDMYAGLKPTLQQMGPEVMELIMTKGKEIIQNMNIPTSIGDITTMIKDKITDIIGGGGGFSNILSNFGIGGSETDPLSNFNKNTEVLNTTVSNFTTQLNNVFEMGKIEFKPLEINENVKIDLNVKLDPDSKNQALTDLMTRALTEYFEGGNNTTNINMILDQMNKHKTGNGLIPGGSGGQYTASAPGKPS